MHNTPGFSSKKLEDDRHQGVVNFGRFLPPLAGQFCTLINNTLHSTTTTRGCDASMVMVSTEGKRVYSAYTRQAARGVSAAYSD